MAKKTQETKYNTNLASEFFVMSMVHRMGLEAYLTLGNKKGLDILVKGKKGKVINLEVKGLRAKNDWPISLPEIEDLTDTFFILLSFENQIQDLTFSPTVWIIPSSKIKEKHYASKNFKCVRYKMVREEWSEYENNWKQIINLLG